VCFQNRDAFRDQVKSFIREGMAQTAPADSGDTVMESATPEVRHAHVVLMYSFEIKTIGYNTHVRK